MKAIPPMWALQFQFGPMILAEAISSCALDGSTVVLGPLSTARPESTHWWHFGYCRIEASGTCTCGMADALLSTEKSTGR
jgi:hypothetical protein